MTFKNMQNGPCCYEPELCTGARACTKKHESIFFTSDQKACEMRLVCGSGSVLFGDFPSGNTWDLYRVAIRSKERTHFQDSEIINIP